MIVTYKSKSCSFEELQPGDVFIFDGLHYMKVQEESDINAVELVCGELSYFDEGDEVFIPTRAELIIS